MERVYIITNDAKILMIISEDMFNKYLEVFEDFNVRRKTKFFIDDTFYESLRVFDYGVEPMIVLGYYYLHDLL